MDRLLRLNSSSLVVLFPSLLFGCTGILGSDAGGGLGSDTIGSTPLAGLDAALAECVELEQEPSVENSPLRRLSHVEYQRTVRDLFPNVDLTKFEFAKDVPIEGFENNAASLNPSPLLVEQYQEAAEDIAGQVVQTSIADAVPCDPAGNESACAKDFIASFGARAFRRPLTQEEIDRYHTFFMKHAGEVSFNAGVHLTLQAFLQSPQFLYRLEFGTGKSEPNVPLSDYELATRLSYLLWQTMPDQELFEAASSGELSQPGALAAQAQRMLQAERAATALADFHRQWFEFDEVLEQEKNPAQFPEWSEDVKRSLHEEALRFVREIFVGGSGTVDELLTSRTTWVNADLAELYGVPAPSDGWAKVELPEDERAGVLTLGAFLASHARPTNGSPPLRGVSVLEQVLCSHIDAPPPSVDTSLPEDDPDAPKTNRQLFESRTSQPSCRSCHESIDGIGFGFENYDAVGRYRTEDNGFPVDASGELVYTDVDGEFEGAVEMAHALAESAQVEHCVAAKWFRYAHGRDETEQDLCKVYGLTEALQEAGGDMRALLVHLVETTEFRHRTPIILD